MRIQIELTDEQANALFEEATADFTYEGRERVRWRGQRRELIRQAILRRMPA